MDASRDFLLSDSCPSPGLCVALGSSGNILTSTNPTGGASDWTLRASTDATGCLNGASCPSANFCVAVDTYADDSAGNVVTWTTPTVGSSTWSLALADPTSGLNAVSCPTTTFWLAVYQGWQRAHFDQSD